MDRAAGCVPGLLPSCRRGQRAGLRAAGCPCDLGLLAPLRPPGRGGEGQAQGGSGPGRAQGDQGGLRQKEAPSLHTGPHLFAAAPARLQIHDRHRQLPGAGRPERAPVQESASAFGDQFFHLPVAELPHRYLQRQVPARAQLPALPALCGLFPPAHPGAATT